MASPLKPEAPLKKDEVDTKVPRYFNDLEGSVRSTYEVRIRVFIGTLD